MTTRQRLRQLYNNYNNRYDLENAWRPFVPLGGIGIVIFCATAYFFSLRDDVLTPRWCPTSGTSGITTTAETTTKSRTCRWMWMHDGMAVYLSSMVLYHLVVASFSSPGVALPTTASDDPLARNKKMDLEKTPKTITKWSCWKGQGGFLGWSVRCDPAVERKRVGLFYNKQYSSDDSWTPSETQLYDNNKRIHNSNNNNNNNNSGKDVILQNAIQQAEASSAPTIHYSPSPQPSFCHQCQMVRPPRCHHSHVFGHCILQYDHYCIWVNNAIGYNNYRSFVLMVFFVMLMCWYGTLMVAIPFWYPKYKTIQQLGVWAFVTTHFGRFLDLPMPHIFMQMMVRGEKVSSQVVLEVLFPLGLSLAIVFTLFFRTHWGLMIQARTTLEGSKLRQHLFNEKITQQENQRDGKSNHFFKPVQVVNLFVQPSVLTNIKQVLGPNLWWCLLPVQIHPPVPVMPKRPSH